MAPTGVSLSNSFVNRIMSSPTRALTDVYTECSCDTENVIIIKGETARSPFSAAVAARMALEVPFVSLVSRY